MLTTMSTGVFQHRNVGPSRRNAQVGCTKSFLMSGKTLFMNKAVLAIWSSSKVIRTLGQLLLPLTFVLRIKGNMRVGHIELTGRRSRDTPLNGPLPATWESPAR